MHMVGRRKNRQYLNKLSSPPLWSRKAVASPPTPRERVQNEVRRRTGPGLRCRAGPSERGEGCAGAVRVYLAHPSAGSPAIGSLPPKKRAGKSAQAGWSKAQRKGGLLGSLQLLEMGESAQARAAWRWPTHRDILSVGEVPAAQEKSGKRCASAVGPMSPQGAQLSGLEAIFFFSCKMERQKL